MASSYLIDMPPQGKTYAAPDPVGQPGPRGSSPLDWAFLVFTAMIPVEVAIQAGLELNFAFGRLILPVMVVLLLLTQARSTRFTVPPRILWCVPWFIVALVHIMLSGDWFPIYNYRTYVLNALCCVVIYNYAKVNRPSVNAVLTALAIGVAVFAVLCASGVIQYGQRAGRLRVFELDENGVGGIFGLGAIAAMILCLRRGYSVSVKVILAAVGVLCISFVVGTGSRGALAALVITVFAITMYMAVYRKNVSFLIGFAALAILGVMAQSFYKNSEIMKKRVDATFDESASNIERFGYRDLIFFETCWLIVEKPFFGWGEKPAWDALGARLRRGGSSHMGTHNTYMQVVVTGGVLFGGMFLWFMLQPLFTARRFLGDPDYAALLLVLIHFFAASLTLDQIGYRLWWWILPLILVRQQQLIAQAAGHGIRHGSARHGGVRQGVQLVANGAV